MEVLLENRIRMKDKDFKLKMTRNCKIDGRLNAGAGWTVKFSNKGHSFSIPFNNSRSEAENFPNTDLVIHGVFSDACGYADTQNYSEFCEEFGYDEYEDRKFAMKVYNGCRKTYENLVKMFGEDGFEKMADIVFNWRNMNREERAIAVGAKTVKDLTPEQKSGGRSMSLSMG